MRRVGDSAVHKDAWSQLYQRGHRPKKIVKVESAGESLTGDTTVVFINQDREAMTALFASQEVPRKKASDPLEYRLHIVILEGWPVEIGA
jgi:hypothetical protein